MGFSVKFEGIAPLYSAFAIVAIESVWPNPDGGELSPDEFDLNLMGLPTDGYGSMAGRKRNKFAQGTATEEEFIQAQGYYKIFPLNILSASTTTSTNGSSFEVKFTLDDLLLITDKDNAQAMSNATGLPINRADLAASTEFSSLFQASNDLRMVTDEELGLARYRISGANSGFNIEDLVTANDTVTIWLYHDPKEFYFKDEGILINEENLTVDKGMNWVIGSGDRRSQYSTESPTFQERMLGVTGLIDEYMETSMQAVVEGQDKPIRGVTQDNVYQVVNSFYREAKAGIPATGKSNRAIDFSKTAFGEGNGEKIYNWLLDPLLNFGDIAPVDGTGSDTVLENRSRALDNFIKTLTPSGDGIRLFSEKYTSESVAYARMLGKDPEELINGLNLFASEMNGALTEHLSSTTNKMVVTRSRQDFSTGRTIITSGDGKPFHGETPYLALRGQISSVKVNIGTVQGAYTVTLSGSGMEKVLGEHEVFYENFFYPGDTKILVDFNVVFANMSPPRAILSLVNAWTPKKVIIGRPSSYSMDSLNMFLRVKAKPPDEGEAATEGEETLEEGENETEIDQIAYEEEVPLRGNFVVSDPITKDGVDVSKTRLFAPVNYVDTIRIREMINVINNSYTNPDQEGVINTAVMLQTKMSLMDNLRRIIGVGSLYEVFTDETGRLRYRITFEAMERTPQPKYIPIVQDVDLLADGASFEKSDANVVTLVDVSPLRSDTHTTLFQLGWVGRSLPPIDAVPITGLGGREEETASSLLYRYGLRTQMIDDIYTSQTNEARRKATLHRGFYGQPIKQATVKVRNSTSYRAGETVFMALQGAKYRSRVPVNLTKTINWIDYLLGDEELLDMYVGADERLAHPEYYAKTAGEFTPIPPKGGTYYNEFKSNPKEFVARKIKDTLTYLQGVLPGVDVITPDYFPPTYWYIQDAGLAFQGWDDNSVPHTEILKLYTSLLKAAVLGSAGDADAVQQIYLKHPGAMNAIKFQDFRATSYYISSVTHSFVQDADASTSLSLNFGQDCLVLLEPRYFLPIGFLSLEKKMRIGYDDEEQKLLYEEYPNKRSPLQNIYLNQYKEDAQFKRGNFLYTSQIFRNISNYMYEIAILDGLDVNTYYDDHSESVDSTVFNAAPTLPLDNRERVNEVMAMFDAERTSGQASNAGNGEVKEK